MATASQLPNLTISVLGCGWLGLPLAQKLAKAGAKVNGSTTTPEKTEVLKQAGISSFLIDLSRVSPVPEEFTRVNCLVVAIPPRAQRGDYGHYLEQIGKVKRCIEISEIKKVLFISSTGVYPEGAGTVTEADATPYSERAQALLKAEELFNRLEGIQTTIIRFGGLFGPGRHPGKFMAGKTNLPNGKAPVNFIHQVDAVNLLYQIITQNAFGQVFNACADQHPDKQSFYTAAAAHAGLPAPHFSAENAVNPTRVNSAKIKQALSYSFRYPDPLAALAELPVPVQ